MTDRGLEQIRELLAQALAPIIRNLAELTDRLQVDRYGKLKVITPGEIAAIHHDLSRLQVQVAELSGRVEVVERREAP